MRRGALKLGQLAADVQALRDVKHFVKDYKGHMLPVDHATGRHYWVYMLPSLSSRAGKRIIIIVIIIVIIIIIIIHTIIIIVISMFILPILLLLL